MVLSRLLRFRMQKAYYGKFTLTPDTCHDICHASSETGHLRLAARSFAYGQSKDSPQDTNRVEAAIALLIGGVNLSPAERDPTSPTRLPARFAGRLPPAPRPTRQEKRGSHRGSG